MRRKCAISSGPRSGGTTTLMVNPNANESTTKRKAGRDSSRLKARESPRHNTHHRGVSVSRDSRTDEVCERISDTAFGRLFPIDAINGRDVKASTKERNAR